MSFKRLAPSVFSSPEQLRDRLAPLRARGKTLVTTNGCFDLIHRGHIHCLYEAAALGDLLVVGVNSDASVRRLKGPDRPLQTETDRAAIVGSFGMVYGVFIFDQDDPRAFIEILRPEIHAKGGDYSQKMIETPIVEKYGGKVVILSLVEGLSTTAIVSSVRA